MKTQTVYIPTIVGEKIPEYTNVIVSCDEGVSFNQVKYYNSFIKDEFNLVTHWLKPKEAYVFTKEELKKLLEDYTDKIIKNVGLKSVEYSKYQGKIINVMNLGEEVPTENPQVYIQVDKDLITSQLNEFLKELE